MSQAYFATDPFRPQAAEKHHNLLMSFLGAVPSTLAFSGSIGRMWRAFSGDQSWQGRSFRYQNGALMPCETRRLLHVLDVPRLFEHYERFCRRLYFGRRRGAQGAER